MHNLLGSFCRMEYYFLQNNASEWAPAWNPDDPDEIAEVGTNKI